MGKYDKHVTVSNFSDAVQNEIDLYCKQITQSVPDAVDQAAKKCLESIKAHVAMAGINDKDYSKSWKKICELKSAFYTAYRVYSEKRYRIAHLLEHGHAKVTKDGKVIGKTKAFPHLIYAEKDSVQFLENLLKKKVQEG